MEPKCKYDCKLFTFEFQAGLHDCALACLKMIARFFEKSLDVNSIQGKLLINSDGVSIYNLREVACDIGINSVAVRCNIKYLVDNINLPVIALIQDHHYVVIYHVSGGQVFIADPAIGCVVYSLKQFEELWCDFRNQDGVLIVFETM